MLDLRQESWGSHARGDGFPGPANRRPSSWRPHWVRPGATTGRVSARPSPGPGGKARRRAIRQGCGGSSVLVRIPAIPARRMRPRYLNLCTISSRTPFSDRTTASHDSLSWISVEPPRPSWRRRTGDPRTEPAVPSTSSRQALSDETLANLLFVFLLPALLLKRLAGFLCRHLSGRLCQPSYPLSSPHPTLGRGAGGPPSTRSTGLNGDRRARAGASRQMEDGGLLAGGSRVATRPLPMLVEKRQHGCDVPAGVCNDLAPAST